MAFGPESTNPRERRAYAHAMIGKLASGEVTYGEALEAAYYASCTQKGQRSGFEGALVNASRKNENDGTSGHHAIRRVPLNWQHPKDESGNHIPLFDSRESSGGKYMISEVEELVEEDGVNPKELPSWFMPTFSGVAKEDMGICLYEVTTEGTPVSPVYPDTEEGRRGLASYAPELEPLGFSLIGLSK